MTIEPKCYVCGKDGDCINGLCYECTMKEFFNPGAAFAATFGSLPKHEFVECPRCGIKRSLHLGEVCADCLLGDQKDRS